MPAIKCVATCVWSSTLLRRTFSMGDHAATAAKRIFAAMFLKVNPGGVDSAAGDVERHHNSESTGLALRRPRVVLAPRTESEAVHIREQPRHTVCI